jgi:hypothetical protein
MQIILLEELANPLMQVKFIMGPGHLNLPGVEASDSNTG